jgi:His-Xaa-Ser system protein HxsD
MKEYSISNGRANLTISEEVYPLEAVLRTAYIFIDDYYVFLDKKEAGQIHVSIRPKNPSEDSLDSSAGEFYNELLNQALRLAISASTKTIRELITSRALYSSYINENEEVITEEENTYTLEEIANNWFEVNSLEGELNVR